MRYIDELLTDDINSFCDLRLENIMFCGEKCFIVSKSCSCFTIAVFLVDLTISLQIQLLLFNNTWEQWQYFFPHKKKLFPEFQYRGSRHWLKLWEVWKNRK